MPEPANNAYGARESLESAIDHCAKAISILNSLEPTIDSAKAVKFAATANVSLQQSIAEIEKITGEK